MNKTQNKPPKLYDICHSVSLAYGTTVALIRSKRRTHKTSSFPRFAATHIARKYGYKHKTIAEYLNFQNHCSSVQAANRMRDILQDGKLFYKHEIEQYEDSIRILNKLIMQESEENIDAQVEQITSELAPSIKKILTKKLSNNRNGFNEHRQLQA